MKKIYAKPEIVFESFSVSASIAANCEKIVTPQLYSCGVNYPGVGVIFTDEAQGCIKKMEDTVMGDGYCYHVPTESANMFNS